MCPVDLSVPILVAVNGSDGSLAAVRYAAKEAARIGCDLKIIHVAPTYLPLEGPVPVAGTVGIADFESAGHDILDASARPAYEFLPKNRVTTTLELGYRVDLVLEAAKSARLLVVGDDRTPLLERITVGRFIGAIAGKAPVPLVSVPRDWNADNAEARVILAVKDPLRIPFELLRAGFQSASDHQAILQIAHVWDVPTGYGAVLGTILEDPSAQTTIGRAVRRLVAPLRDEFPDVSYTTHSWYGRPAQILRERAEGVALLLLSRREHGFPLGHFGATGKALLREAPCPVGVLPLGERANKEGRDR